MKVGGGVPIQVGKGKPELSSEDQLCKQPALIKGHRPCWLRVTWRLKIPFMAKAPERGGKSAWRKAEMTVVATTTEGLLHARHCRSILQIES